MPRFATILVVVTLALAACTDETAETDPSFADTMAAEHAGDAPVASEAAQSAPEVPVEADTVRFGTVDGAALTGYLAAPARADSFAAARGLPGDAGLPGLVVVHEWWGLNDNIRAMTRRLAGQGYRALAVDLYGGRVAEAPDRARALMQEASRDADRIQAVVGAAHDYLAGERDAPRVGVIGWCFGGGVALEAAVAHADAFDAAVVYYGRPVTDRARLDRIDMPVLGLFGADDGSIPVDTVRLFRDRLREVSDHDVEVIVYDGAGHAFANPSGTRYQPEAAERAWAETTRFLETHLMTPRR